MKDDRLYTISQAAEFLGVSVSTLRNWDKQGKFKPIRTPGKQRRYRLGQLKSFRQGSFSWPKYRSLLRKISIPWSISLISLIMLLTGWMWLRKSFTKINNESFAPEQFNLTIVGDIPVIYALYPDSVAQDLMSVNERKALLKNSGMKTQLVNLEDEQSFLDNSSLNQLRRLLNEQRLKVLEESTNQLLRNANQTSKFDAEMLPLDVFTLPSSEGCTDVN